MNGLCRSAYWSVDRRLDLGAGRVRAFGVVGVVGRGAVHLDGVSAVGAAERVGDAAVAGRVIAHVLGVLPPVGPDRPRVRPGRAGCRSSARTWGTRSPGRRPGRDTRPGSGPSVPGVDIRRRPRQRGDAADAVAARQQVRRLAGDLRDVVVQADVPDRVVVLDELALGQQRVVQVGGRRVRPERRRLVLVLQVDDDDVLDRARGGRELAFPWSSPTEAAEAASEGTTASPAAAAPATRSSRRRGVPVPCGSWSSFNVAEAKREWFS